VTERMSLRTCVSSFVAGVCRRLVGAARLSRIECAVVGRSRDLRSHARGTPTFLLTEVRIGQRTEALMAECDIPVPRQEQVAQTRCGPPLLLANLATLGRAVEPVASRHGAHFLWLSRRRRSGRRERASAWTKAIATMTVPSAQLTWDGTLASDGKPSGQVVAG
jgi:hypothetical protein